MPAAAPRSVVQLHALRHPVPGPGWKWWQRGFSTYQPVPAQIARCSDGSIWWGIDQWQWVNTTTLRFTGEQGHTNWYRLPDVPHDSPPIQLAPDPATSLGVPCLSVVCADGSLWSWTERWRWADRVTLKRSMDYLGWSRFASPPAFGGSTGDLIREA